MTSGERLGEPARAGPGGPGPSGRPRVLLRRDAGAVGRAGARDRATACSPAATRAPMMPDVDPAALARLRETEQRAAAAVLGVRQVRFLDQPDGYLTPDLALRKQVVRVLRQVRPEIVVTCDPTNFFPNDRYINHPDHRAAGQATLDAVFPAAGSALFFPELLTDEGLQPAQDPPGVRRHAADGQHGHRRDRHRRAQDRRAARAPQPDPRSGRPGGARSASACSIRPARPTRRATSNASG